MEKYISYREIPYKLGLKKGDVILLSSDITRLVYYSFKNRERFDINNFLDSFIDAIGKDGTLLLPTYNWDFCHGVTFDYLNTPSETGDLSVYALKRNDFKRTTHPIYSFAVTGKYQDLLCCLNNVSSFGSDSPFSFLDLMKAKNVVIDKELTHCFTFVHYVEERAGINTYRYQKMFEADYRDENGVITSRKYSMLVRSLTDYLGTDFDPLEQSFVDDGIQKRQIINKVPFSVIDLSLAYVSIMDDIRNNKSRKLCKHSWQ